MHGYLKGMAVVFLLLALVAIAGCGSHEEPAPVTGENLRSIMVGKEWTVENLYSRKVRGEDLTIEFFSDGKVKAFGGCNELSGAYTLDGDALTFGPMTSTKKSCGAVLDEQEYSFQTFLGMVERVEPDGDDLLLHSRQADRPIVLTTGGGGLFW